MELIILDSAFEPIGVIDAFESLIWTDRYFEAGDFELQTSPNSDNIASLMNGRYATMKESEHFMVIEELHIITDPINGSKMTVKGRSGESISDRRIVERAIEFDEISVDEVARFLLTESFIYPVGNYSENRIVNNFEYLPSTDENVYTILISSQYGKKIVYDSLVDLSYSSGLGWKLTLSEDKKLQFQLYSGVDRSYDQLESPYVVFSPDFENLLNSTYIATTKLLKTVCYTGGEKGVENVQMLLEVDSSNGEKIGLERREMYLDAQDVKRVDDDGYELTDEQYEARLYRRGLEELSKNSAMSLFSSEVDPTETFVYGVDFFLGDILQVKNEYGYEGKSRVVEVTRSVDGSGIKIYPIFSAI
jgi:hypothetical protein